MTGGTWRYSYRNTGMRQEDEEKSRNFRDCLKQKQILEAGKGKGKKGKLNARRMGLRTRRRQNGEIYSQGARAQF